MAITSQLQTLPYDWYADPAVLRHEQEAVFDRCWQYAARLDQVGEPGRIATASAGSLPVVLTRARDGELRAFRNVCRHRGHPLCAGDASRESLQCPYHAWTYGLDGELRSAPRADREPGFDRAGLGLVPVAVDTWGPFVFVNPDAGADPLVEALGVLPELLSEGGVDLDGLRFHTRLEADEYACNWKVAVENFLECYHCQVAHPTFARAIDVSADGYGLRTDRLVATQLGPPRDGGAGVYDASGSIARGQFHVLFPSTVVNVMPGRQNLSIGPVLPRGAERTYRFLDYFVGDDCDDAWLADFLALDEVVGAEDRVLVENVQRGVASGALDHGVLMAESEQLISWFQTLVLEELVREWDSAERNPTA